MKIFLISGSHPRHLYVHKEIINLGHETRALVMSREEMLPLIPKDLPKIDIKNMEFHFNSRLKKEHEVYGDLSAKKIFKNVDYKICSKETINTEENAKMIKQFNPDLVLAFGPSIIKDPVLSILPEDSINMHLGLSPQYKGAATLFWPFYYLEPQFAGITFHRISKKVDAGEILHQCRPLLEHDDGIHDVSAKAVLNALEDLKTIVYLKEKNLKFDYVPQKQTGKLFYASDFKPHHLRLIYDLFDNKIVNEYLNGNLSTHSPELVNGLR
tara:strand:- start:287 stop:1093 length:807 start_codon:yes stop_codon:yes gene_type:complete